MTLTKASFTEMVAAENGSTKKQSSKYVDLLIGIMRITLTSGDKNVTLLSKLERYQHNSIWRLKIRHYICEPEYLASASDFLI